MIQTARLALRKLTEEDAGFILRLLNEPSFLKFVGDKGVRNLDDARRYIREGPIASYAEHGFGLYLVQHRADGSAIGICGLLKRDTLDDPDIGFGLIPEWWSQGLATEATQAILDRARSQHGLKRVVAITAANNDSSKRVLEKIGLEFEKMVCLSDDSPEICLFSTPDGENQPAK
ncbi:MAG: N-acetyltransferase [Gemmatimonadales bacterium]|nr:MAG: N-acetyltransferase [Gemmatimonadales bacterium]